MKPEPPQLDAAQAKSIGRIQIIGVLLLIGVTITLRVLGNGGFIGLWVGLGIAATCALALFLIGAVAVSRVEGTSFMTVARRSGHAVWADLRSQPERVGQRVSAVRRRVRHH